MGTQGWEYLRFTSFFSERYLISPLLLHGSLTVSHRQLIDACQFRVPWVTLKGGTLFTLFVPMSKYARNVIERPHFGKVTQPYLHPKRARPQLPRNFGPPTFAQTLWRSATKIGVLTHGEKHAFRGQPYHTKLEGARSVSPKILRPTYVHTHEKQWSNFARWSKFYRVDHAPCPSQNYWWRAFCF